MQTAESTMSAQLSEFSLYQFIINMVFNELNPFDT